jgi:putative Ca2+/H+ antiporter (TMEM165/GDT1 family)
VVVVVVVATMLPVLVEQAVAVMVRYQVPLVLERLILAVAVVVLFLVAAVAHRERAALA